MQSKKSFFFMLICFVILNLHGCGGSGKLNRLLAGLSGLTDGSESQTLGVEFSFPIQLDFNTKLNLNQDNLSQSTGGILSSLSVTHIVLSIASENGEMTKYAHRKVSAKFENGKIITEKLFLQEGLYYVVGLQLWNKNTALFSIPTLNSLLSFPLGFSSYRDYPQIVLSESSDDSDKPIISLGEHAVFHLFPEELVNLSEDTLFADSDNDVVFKHFTRNFFRSYVLLLDSNSENNTPIPFELDVSIPDLGLKTAKEYFSGGSGIILLLKPPDTSDQIKYSFNFTFNGKTLQKEVSYEELKKTWKGNFIVRVDQNETQSTQSNNNLNAPVFIDELSSYLLAFIRTLQGYKNFVFLESMTESLELFEISVRQELFLSLDPDEYRSMLGFSLALLIEELGINTTLDKLEPFFRRPLQADFPSDERIKDNLFTMMATIMGESLKLTQFSNVFLRKLNDLVELFKPQIRSGTISINTEGNIADSNFPSELQEQFNIVLSLADQELDEIKRIDNETKEFLAMQLYRLLKTKFVDFDIVLLPSVQSKMADFIQKMKDYKDQGLLNIDESNNIASPFSLDDVVNTNLETNFEGLRLFIETTITKTDQDLAKGVRRTLSDITEDSATHLFLYPELVLERRVGEAVAKLKLALGSEDTADNISPEPSILKSL